LLIRLPVGPVLRRQPPNLLLRELGIDEAGGNDPQLHRDGRHEMNASSQRTRCVCYFLQRLMKVPQCSGSASAGAGLAVGWRGVKITDSSSVSPFLTSNSY